MEAATVSLIDVEAVARMLSCSKRHIYRLRDAGRMPQPVHLGGCRRFRRAEIEAWIEAGCPPVRRAKGGAA
ncbi:MAG: helix-turn-helix domain-containing protein [Candidatus Hydrogenedentes bacterium]|nr:helix-turn-helix domain-containing protein [Candidatus Hydrogenedentota bacterium]